MREATDDLARLQLRRGRALLRTLDHWRKVLLTVHKRDVRAARHANRSRREEAILVAILRRNNAVRRHEDRTVELLKLLFLQPPRIAVVAHEVIVLLECGVVMRGDHLAVRINIDARALRLLQETLKILEIMPRNEDAGTIADTELHL